VSGQGDDMVQGDDKVQEDQMDEQVTVQRDPLLDDPPGTRDERDFSRDYGKRADNEVDIAGLCGERGCWGGVVSVTERAADGSRRYECNDPDCSYKARRNWSLVEPRG
jgi:hypothetical protein